MRSQGNGANARNCCADQVSPGCNVTGSNCSTIHTIIVFTSLEHLKVKSCEGSEKCWPCRKCFLWTAFKLGEPQGKCSTETEGLQYVLPSVPLSNRLQIWNSNGRINNIIHEVTTSNKHVQSYLGILNANKVSPRWYCLMWVPKHSVCPPATSKETENFLSTKCWLTLLSRCTPKTTCHWNENIEAKTKFYLAEEVLPAIGNGDITANPIVQVELIWSFEVQAVIKSWKVDGFPGHQISRMSRHYSVLCMKCLYILNRKQ